MSSSMFDIKQVRDVIPHLPFDRPHSIFGISVSVMHVHILRDRSFKR